MAAKKKSTRKKKASGKTSKSSTATVTTIIPDEQALDLKMEIGTNDIVAIGVAEYENDVRRNINVSKKAWQAAKTELQTLEKKLAAEIKSTVKKAYAHGVTLLNKALAGLQIDKRGTLSDGLLNSDEKEIIATVDHNGSELRLNNIPIPPSVRSAIQAVKDQKKDLEEARKVLVAYQGELNNMDYAERQIRAQVSQSALRGSKQGKNILKAIGVAKFVPQLPG